MSHEAAPTPKPHGSNVSERALAAAMVVSVVMVLLATGGFALTTVKSPWAKTYWVLLVPVYAGLCVFTAWYRAGPGQLADHKAMTRQLFHWLGLAVAFTLDYFILRTGEETTIAAADNALLLLALGCYLAGVHLEPLFILVGMLLTLTLVVVVKFEQYDVILFGLGALLIAGLIFARWATARVRARREAKS